MAQGSLVSFCAQGAEGNVILASLSGTIGAGKSTAIAMLEETNLVQDALRNAGVVNAHVCFVREPSQKWRKHGWTTRFYANPKERALAFQFLIFTTHVKAVQKALRGAREALRRESEGTLVSPAAAPAASIGGSVGGMSSSPAQRAGGDKIVCIVERCMWDQLLFWKVQGSDPMDDDAYMQVWRRWDEFLPRVSIVFFCKTTDLQTTLERVQSRGIAEEKDMDIDYQIKLYEKHEAWYPASGTTDIQYRDGKRIHKETSVRCVHISTDGPYHASGGVGQAALKELATTLAEHLKVFFN